MTLRKLDPSLAAALRAACTEAEAYRGATAPNPAVGSAAMDENGNLLSVQAHRKAGEAHAEARVLEDLQARGLLERIHTMVVTLEPCNHQGRTPPCAAALLKLPSLRRVIFAVSDPNPKAVGGGHRLSQAGLEVVNLSLSDPQAPELERARDLSRPFFHWIRTGHPWVTLKTAWRRDEKSKLTMRPPAGQKTFTRPSSLEFAHQLRKRADAIVSGSGTVLADDPAFTVRQVGDHSGKSRWLAILDRSGRVPQAWLETKRQQAFRIVPREESLEIPSLLKFLGGQGVLEVLVEAGPTLSGEFLKGPHWNEHFRILHEEDRDIIERELRTPDVHRDY